MTDDERAFIEYQRLRVQRSDRGEMILTVDPAVPRLIAMVEAQAATIEQLQTERDALDTLCQQYADERNEFREMVEAREVGLAALRAALEEAEIALRLFQGINLCYVAGKLEAAETVFSDALDHIEFIRRQEARDDSTG